MIYRDESRHMYKRWYKDHYSPKFVYFAKRGGGGIVVDVCLSMKRVKEDYNGGSLVLKREKSRQ